MKKYSVRVLGQSSYGDYNSLAVALENLELANRTCQPNHTIINNFTCNVVKWCDSCREAGEYVEATTTSVNPDWSGYDLCADCAREYDSRKRW